MFCFFIGVPLSRTCGFSVLDVAALVDLSNHKLKVLSSILGITSGVDKAEGRSFHFHDL